MIKSQATKLQNLTHDNMLHYKKNPMQGSRHSVEIERNFGGIISLLSHRSSNLSYHEVHIFMIHDVDT
jgi:hypothetical protein